jgi:peptide/nickel transport system substrate-binding protein
MASFFSYLTTKKIPRKDELRRIIFGPLSWQSVILSTCIVSALIVGYIIIISINDRFLVTVPAPGGSITEGVIGAPRFINPLLAATTTDTALTELIFAGLMTYTPSGSVERELADSYSISPDGRTYTFTLKDKLVFHDNTPLTSGDISYTIEKLQDPLLNHNDYQYWQSLIIDIPDARTISIRIPAPDTNFLQRMTFGILPKHLWQNVSSEAFADSALNLRPIGAGPFSVASINSTGGVPTEVALKRNAAYVRGKPYLAGLRFVVYANQANLASAVKSGTVESTEALEPRTIATTNFSDALTITKVPTTKTVALYRSKNETVLASVPVVNVINRIIDKDSLLATVENGYGLPLGTSPDIAQATREESMAALNTAGYAQAPDGTFVKGKTSLGFSIAVENTPTLLLAARTLANQLTAYGFIVTVQAFDPGVVQDEVASSHFPVFLTDEVPPASYSQVLELYTEVIPYVARAQVHIEPPAVLSRSVLRYSNAHLWYRKTDRVWRWLEALHE